MKGASKILNLSYRGGKDAWPAPGEGEFKAERLTIWIYMTESEQKIQITKKKTRTLGG